MLVIPLTLTFVAVFVFVYFSFPGIVTYSIDVNQKRQRELSKQIEVLLSRQEAQRISRVFIIAPIVVAGICVLIIPDLKFKIIGAAFIFLIGLVFPTLYIRYLKEQTKRKFQDQLVDALMIMSSCMRAGLSLIQALEAVVDEMNEPISREFSVMLGENKMGVSLEDSLNYLYNRMTSSYLQQVNTAVLLARETGGNLPLIFQRISSTIRENKKVQQQLSALTIQGRIQAFVMITIPIIFGFILFRQNRAAFDLMLTTREGHLMLMVSAVLWVVGTTLVLYFSRVQDY